MRSVPAIENLSLLPVFRFRLNLLQLLVRWESWLDARQSRRALYELDERALADIGLSSADLGQHGPASWHGCLTDQPLLQIGERR